MKLNEKLFELRRKAGLSQEELADRVGVSRQAVGKWESGASVPELDKLLALCEYFQVSIGALLGLETQDPDSAEGPVPEAPDLTEVKALLDGLARQQRDGEETARRRRKKQWILTGFAGAVLAVVIVLLAVRISDLEHRLGGLSAQLVNTEHILTGNMQSLQVNIEGLLAEQDSLFSDWSAAVTDFDPDSREVTVELSATPKLLTEGTSAEFTLRADDGSGEYTAAALLDGTAFRAQVVMPLEPTYSQWLEDALEYLNQAQAAGVGHVDPDAVIAPVYFLTVALTDGETTRQQELGSLQTGIWELVGAYSFAWYADTASENPAAGLLALYADSELRLVSARLVTYLNGVEADRRTLDVDNGDRWYDSFPMPEKYLHRQFYTPEGDAIINPTRLGGKGARVYARELTPDIPAHEKGDTVSFLLEVTDDRGITYAGFVLSGSPEDLARDTYGRMTPVIP